MGCHIGEIKVVSIRLKSPLVLANPLAYTFDHIVMLKVESEKPHKPKTTISQIFINNCYLPEDPYDSQGTNK